MTILVLTREDTRPDVTTTWPARSRSSALAKQWLGFEECCEGRRRTAGLRPKAWAVRRPPTAAGRAARGRRGPTKRAGTPARAPPGRPWELFGRGRRNRREGHPS